METSFYNMWYNKYKSMKSKDKKWVYGDEVRYYDFVQSHNTIGVYLNNLKLSPNKQGKKAFAPSATKSFKAKQKEFLTLKAKRLLSLRQCIEIRN